MPFLAPRRAYGSAEQRVLSALRLYPLGSVVSNADILCETGLDPEVIDRTGAKLAERGEVLREGSERRGWAYRLPQKGPHAASQSPHP